MALIGPVAYDVIRNPSAFFNQTLFASVEAPCPKDGCRVIVYQPREPKSEAP